VYKQRSEKGIDGRENCEVIAEAQGGFISGRGRGGKVSSGQNRRRRRKGERGMVHWGGGRKCAVEKTAEQSVAASDSGKTMMSAATGPTCKLLHTYTSPPRQLCPYAHIAVPLLPLSFLFLLSPLHASFLSFPFLSFLPFQFATYSWPSYFASLPCLPPLCKALPQDWAVHMIIKKTLLI
jgi:hypothetical protein